MNYRKDIDGLRAIAVSLVVLYHFGFTSISGGFVGVDVFFVLSGFLITLVIKKQIEEQKFSFKEFYIRRIKRLMPALIVMIGVTYIAFSLILTPSDYSLYAQSIIYVSLYVANVFYWLNYAGYFAGETQEAAYLHTWSLAVEEQFYFIFPLYLIIVVKFFGWKKATLITFAVTIFSAIFSEIATQRTIGASYYLLPTRAFELLIGSCVALCYYKIPKLKQGIVDSLSIMGIALILLSGFVLDHNDSFPGLNALYPTIGSALLIISGARRIGVVNRLISNKPMVGLGLISYSLYLWHWPLVVMLNYTDTTLTLSIQLALIVTSLIVSYLSYQYVEKPCRFSREPNFQVIGKYYIAPSLILILCSVYVVHNKGLPERMPSAITVMEQAINSHPNIIRSHCHASLRDSEKSVDGACISGSDNPVSKGLLIGDSHANHITGFLDVIGKEEDFSIQDYTLDRCPPIFDLNWGKSGYKSALCKARNDVNKELVKSGNYDFVVLGASWPNLNSTMVYDDELKQITERSRVKEILSSRIIGTAELISKQGLSLIIIKDVPYLENVKFNCAIKEHLYSKGKSCNVPRNENTLLEEVIAKLRKNKQIKSLRVISPKELVCQEGMCKTVIDGIPLYRDEDHLNDKGSRVLAKKYIAEQVIANNLKERAL